MLSSVKASKPPYVCSNAETACAPGTDTFTQPGMRKQRLGEEDLNAVRESI